MSIYPTCLYFQIAHLAQPKLQTVQEICNNQWYIKLTVEVRVNVLRSSCHLDQLICCFRFWGKIVLRIRECAVIGQIIGGIVGAHVLSGIKAAFVRKLLIVMLFLTSLKLLSRGIEGLFNISIPFI